jgi:lysophospholipase L1-like esterase
MLHGNFGMDFDSDFLDYGSDNCHPGPKTHKLYADMILDKIKKLGWQ